jgi:photosynthetic reaction center cytochrome c subunit
VDEILARFVDALGGVDAVRKVTSRVMKGVIVTGGNQAAIELFTKAPNQRISISHMGNSDSYTAFDGTVGWLGSTGRPAREMTAAESAAAGLDAEFYLALRLKEIYPQLRRGRPEEIRGVECEVLNGSAPGASGGAAVFREDHRAAAANGALRRYAGGADTDPDRLRRL